MKRLASLVPSGVGADRRGPSRARELVVRVGATLPLAFP